MSIRILCMMTFLLFNFILNTISQISDSPYTLFGAGQIQDNGFGTNMGMGGTGIAFKSQRYLNNLNPASYTGIDSLNFIFEFGCFGNVTRFESYNMSKRKTNGNIRYLATGLKIWRWWAVSAGVIPYSSVGYRINSSEIVEGLNITTNKLYSGSGGISQLYLGNAFLIDKHLSLGINISYLFGKITQSEEVESNGYFSEYTVNNYYYMSNFHMDYGLQYTLYINQMSYSLGIIFGNERKLNTRNEVVLELDDDSVSLEKDDTRFYIPAKFGVGFSIARTEIFKAGIDYEFNRWSQYKFSNALLNTRDSERFAAGMEYCPRKSYRDRGLKMLNYRAGLNYKKTYLSIDHTPINSAAVSLGLGIPLKNIFSHINLSFEAGEYGTTKNKLIRERFYTLHANFTLRDIWFEKVRYH